MPIPAYPADHWVNAGMWSDKGLEPDKTLAWELVGFEVGFGTEARSADKIIARLRTRLRRDRTSVISRSSRLGRAVAGEGGLGC
jgi:hypothetical protein